MNPNINIGLNDKEVLFSRNKFGSNELTKRKRNTFLIFLLESFNDPIIKILLIALGIKIVFLFKNSNIYETLGIVVAIFIASLISTISEYGSEKAFEKLVEESSKVKCKVKRNSKYIEVILDEVVVGDIVILEAGDKIPADGIIVKGSISVDESSLTGETKEKYKDFNRDNKVFRGSVVVSETAIMKVLNVGDNTFYGEVVKGVQELQPESPLKTKLRGLARIISRFGYIGAILVVISYLFNVIFVNNNFELDKITSLVTNFNMIFPHIIYALTLAVAIIVVAVPEGLPMMITLVLSSNMKRMLRNNVLVRKLVGIETAGSLNILFADKTGTLTEGKLKVTGLMTADGKEYRNIHLMDEKRRKLFEISLLYNNASTYDENNKIIGGNITDKAILEFLGNKYVKDLEVLKFFPFDNKLKYSYVKVKYNEDNIFIKGAYEKLLENCKWYYTSNGNKEKIMDINFIKRRIQEKTEKGIRVLTVATCPNEELKNLSLLGFIFIKDEVRKEAISGIKLVKEANIQTVMITGDAKETAVAVAKELKLLENINDVILTSEELNRLSDDQVKLLIPRLKVIARSLPQDKSRMVRLSQELGLIVGMTGDGVNDAPALKKADVGFAMGSGTEVAKEVSDIIILDDNFLSISKSILYGRTIFKSIRKFIIFQLTINLCAVTLSVIGPFIGILEPVTVIQMLWINMVMDTLAGLAFAFEPPLIDYMKEPPKKRNEPIMNKYMINQITFIGFYFSILCILFLKSSIIHSLFRIDNNDKYLMTAFFGLFIFMAIFNSFNARTHRLNLFAHILKNKAFIIVISFILIVQLILIYFGGEIFRTTGLTLLEFEIMVFLAFTVIPIDIIRKLILRRKKITTGV